MSAERSIEVHPLLWRGVNIEITYEPCWLSLERSDDLRVAHLTVTSLQPARAKLPITETGYRSRFLDPGDVAEVGGPVAFVIEWLDYEAESANWKAHEQGSRQLTLF